MDKFYLFSGKVSHAVKVSMALAISLLLFAFGNVAVGHTSNFAPLGANAPNMLGPNVEVGIGQPNASPAGIASLGTPASLSGDRYSSPRSIKTGTGNNLYSPALIPLTITGTYVTDYNGTKSFTFTDADGLDNLVLGNINPGEPKVKLTELTGTILDKNSGNGKTLTITGYKLGGEDADYYTLTQSSITVDVKPLGLDVIGISVDDKVYDGTTNAKLNWVGTAKLSGPTALLLADGVGLNKLGLNALFDSKDAGVRTVTVTGFAIDNINDDNYTINPSSLILNATITKKPLTVSATCSDKVYDGITDAVVTLSTTDNVAGEVLTFTSDADFASKDAGNQIVHVEDIVVTGAYANNYTWNTEATTTANITPKNLTISGVSVENKIYNAGIDATLKGTATLVGTVGPNVTLVEGTGIFADDESGDNKVVSFSGFKLAGSDAKNYTLTQPPTVEADIFKKPLTITVTASDKEYDGDTDAEVILKTTDNIAGEVLTFTFDADFSTPEAGTNPVNVKDIVVTGDYAENYTWNDVASTTAKITPKGLTISGVTYENKTYDGTRNLEYTWTGAWVGKIADDDVTLTGLKASFADKNVGVNKPITFTGVFGGTKAADYTLSLPATYRASVLARDLSIDVKAKDKVYDGKTDAVVTITPDPTDVMPGDAFTFTYDADFTSKNVNAGVQTVKVEGIAILTGNSAGNYILDESRADVTARITPKELSVVAVANNKVYDGDVDADADVTVTPDPTDVIVGDVLTLDFADAHFTDQNFGILKTVNVDGITIKSGNSAGNYILERTTATAKANINPKVLSVIADASDKVYDGNDDADVTLIPDPADVVGGDVLTLAHTGADFTSKNVVGEQKVNIKGITIASGNAFGNYVLESTTASDDAKITPKDLSVTVIGNTKVYDRTLDAKVTITPHGLVSDDEMLYDYTAAFTDRNVDEGGSAVPISVTDIKLKGDDAVNYKLVTALPISTSAVISPAKLTVKGVTAKDRMYNGNRVVDLDVSNAVLADLIHPELGLIALDNVTLTKDLAIGEFVTKDAGNNMPINITGFKIVGDPNEYNYSLDQPTVTANISRVPLRITGITAKDKDYDGDTEAELVTTAAKLEGILGTDIVNLESGSAKGIFTVKDVLEYQIVNTSGFGLSGADAGNYEITPFPKAIASITPEKLILTAKGVDKIYNGETDDAQVTFEPWKEGNDDVNITCTAKFEKDEAGIQNIIVTNLKISGPDARNYSSDIKLSGIPTATIKKRELEIKGLKAENKTYDHSTSVILDTDDGALKLDPDDLIADDDVNLVKTAATGTFEEYEVGTGINVTTTGFAITGGDALNYALVQPSTKADITPAILTISGVTAENKTFDGDADADLEKSHASLVGVFAPDALKVTLESDNVTGTFIDEKAGSNKKVNVAGFKLEGDEAHNYSLTQPQNVTASIDKKMLIVTADINTKTYDGEREAVISKFNLSNLVDGKKDVTPSADAHFIGSEADENVEVNVTNINLTGTDAGNYDWNRTYDTFANITYKTLRVGGLSVQNKTYDGNNTAVVTGTAVLEGNIGTDNVTLVHIGEQLLGSFPNKKAGTNLPVTISGTVFDIQGTDAGNYILEPLSLKANITPKPLDITGVTANNKVYDGNNNATFNMSSHALPAVILNDVVTLDYTNVSAKFSDKNVGSLKTVSNITGLVLVGADKDNYVLNQLPDMKADISSRPLVVSAIAVNKDYNGTPTANVTLSDNRISGDVLATAHLTAEFDTKNVGTGKTVTVSGISITGTDAGNYTHNVTATTTANISSIALTVNATGKNKVYDGTPAAEVTLSDNRISGDGLTITHNGPVFSDKNVGENKTITFDGIAISGTDALNYTVNHTASTFANITVRGLTVSAAADNKVYDGSTSATVSLSDNRFSGDGLTINHSGANFLDKNVGNGKTVTVDGITISGSDASNYAFNSSASTTANITVRGLTVSAAADNKVYDGSTSATVSLSDNRFSGDGLTINHSGANFLDKNVGNGKTVTVDGITISGSDASNYAFNSSASTTANITVRGLTVSAAADNKVYDGSTSATVSLSDNRFSGDGLTINHSGANFSDKNVGNGKTVTVDGITISGSDASNYAFNSSASTTANITVRGLTVSAAADNKVYDGSTSATVSLSDNRFSGDGLTINHSGANFLDKNVGNGKTVTVDGITISGSDASNYAFNSSASTTANITVRGLTVSAAADNKVYDGSTSATVSLSDNRFSGDGLTINHSGANFLDKNVGNGKTVTVDGITISGSDASNYAFNSSASTTANITARDLTVSAAAGNKVYDGSTSATVTLSDNRFSGDGLTINHSGANFSDKNVGNGKSVTVDGITISGSDASNYAFNSSASTTANITARDLTVSAAADNKVYDGSTSATVTLSDNRFSGDGLTINHVGANFSDKNVGNGKSVTVDGITISGSDASNYAFNSSASTTANITVRGLTVSAAADNKVYDGSTSATVSLSDNRFSGDGLTINHVGANFSNKNVGNNKTVNVNGITISGSDASNYAFNSSVSTTANITVRGLTVSAAADNKVYDGSTSATVSLSDNRISGDGISTAYNSASFSDKNVGNNKTVNINGITISGSDASNYAFNQAASTTANITGRALTVTAVANNKVYDGTPLATVSLTDNRLSGDVLTASNSSASFSDKNVGNNKTVNVNGITISGTDAVNYTANTSANSTANITSKLLTINATGIHKVYDGTPLATVSLSDNRISGDGISTAYNSASFSNKNVGNNKTVNVNGITISGSDASNYAFNQAASTTANITGRALTVTAVANNKVYDGTPLATVSLTDNRLSGDVLTASNSSASFSDKNVGNNKTVNVNGITISGTDAVNYTANTSANSTASITSRLLTINATGFDKVYDGTPLATVTLSDDRLSGDVLSASNSAVTFSDKNVGTGKAINVAGITINGTDAGNYTHNNTASAIAAITRKPLTVSATGMNKVYDGSTSATVTLSDDHLLGDNLTVTFTNAAFSDKNIGMNKTVNVNGISISGNDALNYANNSTATATANITSVGIPITITGVTVNSKVFDGTTTATLNTSAAALSGVMTFDIVTLNSTGATATFADMNAGAVKTVNLTGFAIGGADAGNYTLVAPTVTTSITPKPLTITCNSSSKCFGTTPAFLGTEFTPVGLIGNDAVNRVTLTSNGTLATAVAGTYDIVASNAIGTGLSNYSINYVKGTMTVNPLANQPADFTLSTATVCKGSSAVVYRVPNDPTVTYTWSYSGTGATINGTSNSVTVDFSSTATSGNLSVTASTACGLSTARSMAITASAPPATPVVTIDAVLQVTMTSSATTGNQWYDANGIISGATNQTYRATHNGNYYVKVTGNCSTVQSNIVNVTHVSVPEFEKPTVNVYPNPSTGEFWVKFKASGNEKLKMIQVYNNLGKAVYQATPSSVTNDLTEWVSIKNQPTGVYTLVLTTDNQRISRQIVITK